MYANDFKKIQSCWWILVTLQGKLAETYNQGNTHNRIDCGRSLSYVNLFMRPQDSGIKKAGDCSSRANTLPTVETILKTARHFWGLYGFAGFVLSKLSTETAKRHDNVLPVQCHHGICLGWASKGQPECFRYIGVSEVPIETQQSDYIG